MKRKNDDLLIFLRKTKEGKYSKVGETIPSVQRVENLRQTPVCDNYYYSMS